MKIVQICLSGLYNPSLGYQDNILPKYYKKLGYTCTTITSQYYREGLALKKSNKYKEYINEGISIIRLPSKYNLSYKLNKTFRLFNGIYKALTDEKPDIIFLHNFQFLSINQVIKYCKSNRNVLVYVDSHTDYVNSASNWFSKKILHGIIWKNIAHKILPYVKKFWGVTRQRCDFLLDMYKIPSTLIDLLIMGADKENIRYDKKPLLRKKILSELNIQETDFIIVSGGKIDEQKKIDTLIKAIDKIMNPKIKLIIFGSIPEKFSLKIQDLINKDFVHFVGWIDSNKVYDYFLISNLGVFPGTHSVLWEQALGTGLPCIFKEWYGFDHLIQDKCSIYLKEVTVDSIANEINDLVINHDKYIQLKKNAQTICSSKFSYFEIAKKSIEYGTHRKDV